MKTMKSFLTLTLAFICSLNISSQNTIHWLGGTPGHESEWNEPRNWDANRVPIESDKVIISNRNNGHFKQPVISGEVQIAWLEILSGGNLTISNSGILTIDGSNTYSEGISIYGGAIHSDGEILFKGVELGFLEKNAPVCLERKYIYYSTAYQYNYSVVSTSFDEF